MGGEFGHTELDEKTQRQGECGAYLVDRLRDQRESGEVVSSGGCQEIACPLLRSSIGPQDG